MRLFGILLFYCLCLAASSNSSRLPRPTKDHALFFAIQDYDNWTDLKNPIRDAEAIAQQLRTNYEFDDLKIVTNPTLETIQATLNQYLTKTYGPDDQLFIFFSGHGAFNDLTTEGFFIPKGGLKNDPYQNSYLPLTRLERIISNIPCAHILLTIDACYSGTFNESIALDKSDPTNPTWRRPGVDPGNSDAKAAWIAAKLAKRSRICITSGGKERTSDGIEHSPLTEAFLKGLANPDEDEILTVDELVAGLKNLQPGPKTFTFGTHQSDGSFLFIQQEKTPTNFNLQSYEQRQRDIQAWTTAKTTNTPSAYLDYLQKFPQGTFREEASKALATAAEDQEWELTRLRNTPTAYQAYLSRYPAGRYTNEAKKNLQPTAAPDRDRDGIPDASDRCPDQFGPGSNNGCPLPPPIPTGMVLVQGGTFQMGDVIGDKEETDETVHTVTVSSFLLAKNELTFDEYDAFCKATGRELPSDSGWGRGKRPAINVDWYDAIEYCNWRSGQEGLQAVYSIDKNTKDPNNYNTTDPKKWLVTTSRSANGYRLPTEAEWEYAARAGGKKVRFGNGKDTADPQEINFDASLNYKKHYSIAGEYRQKTIPVGSFSPNSLNLFDMSGNVREWCGDWYGTYPSSASNDPQGVTGGYYRVFRSGSWDRNPEYMRVARRSTTTPAYLGNSVGFRLARQQ